ncbi:oxygen-independent coproporphyrinogen III oxidase [Marinomonas agarivorans]|nr:oxygen-independent coproporphyrinogen III oxidase [Marinomonas agarivorans]
MIETPQLRPELLNKYNLNGPRYTSYPTALEFHNRFDQEDFKLAIQDSTNKQLSLYVHVPFCHSMCYYCGCNKIVTRQKNKADRYLDYLEQEIVNRAPLFTHHKVIQLHLGGGTPSFLSAGQFTRLMGILRQHFQFQTQVEMSIEIDPREIELNLLDHLKNLGFNRLSFGLQDTNLIVQEAINRVQDTEFVQALLTRARELNYDSINLDLIYGLPHQTSARFQQTLEKVMLLNPDRISLFSYAHLPTRFAAQRKIRDEWLPSGDEKLSLMLDAMAHFTANGYVAIGMDHFAKPDDELALAQKQQILHRNFQGYTTKGECDLLGLGVSSISSIGKAYAQNTKKLKDYYQAIEDKGQAVEKGVSLSQDDIIRGAVIKALMCNFMLDKDAISKQFSINFDHYFKAELIKLNTFLTDGLITITPKSIMVLAEGRLLIRSIAMAFDAYLNAATTQAFSKVI